MTPADLRKLLEGATPGEWQAQRDQIPGIAGFGIRNEYRDEKERRCHDMIGVLQAAGDAALIAAAVNALPALLAVAEAAAAVEENGEADGEWPVLHVGIPVMDALRAALEELERAK